MIVKISGLLNASLIGFTTGGMVGVWVWLVDHTRQRIIVAQQQNEHKDEVIAPTSELTEVKNQVQPATSLPERKYRIRRQQVLLSFLPLLYFIPVTLLLIGISTWFVYDLFGDTDSQLLGFVTLVLLGSGSLLAAIFCLYLITVPLFYAFGTYLRVSPQGLEYLRWPYFGLRCGWDDIECLGKARTFTGKEYAALYLRRSDRFSWQLSTKIRQKLGLRTNWRIPLHDLQGWSADQLRDDLRHYVPHLFPEDRSED